MKYNIICLLLIVLGLSMFSLVAFKTNDVHYYYIGWSGKKDGNRAFGSSYFWTPSLKSSEFNRFLLKNNGITDPLILSVYEFKSVTDMETFKK